MNFVLDRRQLLVGSAMAVALGTVGMRRADAATHMRFLWWGSKDRADRTFKAIKAYEAKHSDVSIEGESFGWDNYWTRLATQTAGGNAPDLIQMDYRYMFEYARRGTLLDLSPYLNKTLQIADFGQSNIDSGKVDGKLYAVSMGVNSVSLVVDLAAWKEAGVAPPKTGTSWDDFIKAAADLTKATKRHEYYGTADASGLEQAFECWLRQRGKGLYTEDGKIGFTADDTAEWFDMWAKARAMKACVPAATQALYQLTVETDMVTLGKAGVGFANSNQFVAYQAINKDKLGLAAFPTGGAGSKPGQYMKPAMQMSVAATSKNKDAAVAFINYLMEDPEGAGILGLERGVPASAQIRQALAPKLDPLGVQMVEYIEEISSVVGPLPPAPPLGAGENSFLIKTVAEEVAFGKSSPKDAGASFAKQAAANLKRG